MIDLIDPNDESRIRYRARRRGFQVLRTRGREYRRRLACGQGDLMLLDADKVVLFAATLEEIAIFLKADDKAKKRLMHLRSSAHSSGSPALRTPSKKTSGTSSRARSHLMVNLGVTLRACATAASASDCRPRKTYDMARCV
jgi:hypothetical protein